ncbi:MAG: MBL fold metallo-hydrolase [Desertimonas sp.]
MATLDWYGCATFRLRIGDLTVFLDAYIDRVPGAAGPGLTANDIDGCDWIVVGHAHFDHLAGAERILANHPEARLIGSYESVKLMEQAGIAPERMIAVAGGERVRLSDDVVVNVFPSQHSCVWSHTSMLQSGEVCLGDLGVTWQEQQERFAQLAAHLGSLSTDAVEHLRATAVGQSPRGDGGALLYLFETPEGTVLFQDTSGHWSGILDDLSPDVAILAAAGRGNIDGEPIQGSLADFIGRQVAALEPKRLFLGHHDDWLPGFSVATEMGPLRAVVAATSPDTELLEPGYVEGTDVFG